MKIDYEDMFDPSDDGRFHWRFVEKVSSFLGLENQFKRDPKLQKLMKGDPLANVENADEIHAVLEGKVERLLSLHQLERIGVYLGDKNFFR